MRVVEVSFPKLDARFTRFDEDHWLQLSEWIGDVARVAAVRFHALGVVARLTDQLAAIEHEIQTTKEKFYAHLDAEARTRSASPLEVRDVVDIEVPPDYGPVAMVGGPYRVVGEMTFHLGDPRQVELVGELRLWVRLLDSLPECTVFVQDYGPGGPK